MASPAPTGPAGAGRVTNAPAHPPGVEQQDPGMQIRVMGLKVHYTFDAAAQQNCLARYAGSISAQTIAIDQNNAIGLVDLRMCMQAVLDCSPELANPECDYTIYALDYSEPDTPLVGQGMLSWTLDSMQNPANQQPPKMVIGRVTKNMLGFFSGGIRETLEVRLKFSLAVKHHRPDMVRGSSDLQQPRSMETALTPTGSAEWNSFMQANPQIAQPTQPVHHTSPALPESLPVDHRRRDSFGPTLQPELQRIAPMPVDAPPPLAANPSQPPSRPVSRSTSRPPRKKPPTGRPRGRPRKKPVEGNTSGYEDGTEGEDGPAKKRAKVTQVVDKAGDYNFGAVSESLRVTASTAGSLRNFRPIAAATNTTNPTTANHLQEIPRAPTPVPNASARGPPGRGGPLARLSRQESGLSQTTMANQRSFVTTKPVLAPSDDGRSPESIAPTPNYSDDSPADIGSSPPVPRTTPYLQSSPPPSSPVLPPMPSRQQSVDLGLGPKDGDDLFGDEPFVLNQDVLPSARLEEANMDTGLGQSGNFGASHPSNSTLVDIVRGARGFEKAPIRPHPSRPQPKEGRYPPTPPATTDAAEKCISPAPGSQSTGGSKPLTPRESVDLPSEANHPAKPSLAQPEPPKSQGNRSKNSRRLDRSQSVGMLVLPTVPASEPVGPSSLSQTTHSLHDKISAVGRPSTLQRSASEGPKLASLPASDPVGPVKLVSAAASTALSRMVEFQSEISEMPSSPPAEKSNKNVVKKIAIKQRLEEAILNGEMPPFCSNCGAIETPTWRKIWVQDREGSPEYVEYSEKPGRVTAIDITRRDDDEKPCAYRLIKKSLGPSDERKSWQEHLLCNPCGIWLCKFKCHRPPDRWDKDASRLGQERRKKGAGGNGPRGKRSRSKTDTAMDFTSEAFQTDPCGPEELLSPRSSGAEHSQQVEGDADVQFIQQSGEIVDSSRRSNSGTSHSKASEVANSPITVELDEAMGSTKRLLFPSPRKDGVPKVLGELSINLVQTSQDFSGKVIAQAKENHDFANARETDIGPDEFDALFRSPTDSRCTTPPPNSRPGDRDDIFKTPAKPTPSHRPVTRSVSRSIRSVRSIASPHQSGQLQRTPSKTPSKTPRRLGVAGNCSLRRSPRNHQPAFDVFDTPMTRSINQMLSEPNALDFGDHELDLGSLPGLDSHHDDLVDFGSFLSTDAVMPSSPPRGALTGFDYGASRDAWSQWGLDAA